jgi:hypothetical protein
LRPGNDANDANNAPPPPGLSAAAARRDEAAEEAETAAVVLRDGGGRRGEPRHATQTHARAACFVDRIILLFHRGTNYIFQIKYMFKTKSPSSTTNDMF